MARRNTQRLATHEWVTKNHYFYAAKCGFERVEDDPFIGEAPGQAIYRKTVSPR